MTEQIVVPGDLLRRYVDVAMRRAVPEQLAGSDQWFAKLPGFSGVWADGQSPKQCLDTLTEVLCDWVILKIADRDMDLPPVDEIDLRVLYSR